MGDAPTLGTVSKAWGDNITESWLEMQLIDLSEFSGVKDKLSSFQLDSLAQVIIASWGHYKVTEMMLFFQQFKSGKYGRFYGAVDSMVITEALHDFDKERCQAIDHYRRIEEEQQRKLQSEGEAVAIAKWHQHVHACHLTIREYLDISKREGLTPAEMETVGWLFNMGYEPWRLSQERKEAIRAKSSADRQRAHLDALIAQLQHQRDALPN